jgi:hypothetical protein
VLPQASWRLSVSTWPDISILPEIGSPPAAKA